jgi:hypothetical protein
MVMIMVVVVVVVVLVVVAVAVVSLTCAFCRRIFAAPRSSSTDVTGTTVATALTLETRG